MVLRDPGSLLYRSGQDRTTVAAELPWGASKVVPLSSVDYNLPTGVFLGQSLLSELFSIFEKKIPSVAEDEPLEKLLNKSLQRGGDAGLDNLCRSIAGISELCLPSVLEALLEWQKRMDTTINEKITASTENRQVHVKKQLAINYLLCLVLIEILPQLECHTAASESHLRALLDLAFKHMQYKALVYMIRNNMDNNTSTRNRLESFCGSLFPKGNRNIVLATRR